MSAEVVIIYDGETAPADVVSTIESVHSTVAVPLREWKTRADLSAHLAVLDVDLAAPDVTRMVREAIEVPTIGAAPRVFIFDDVGRRQIVQSVVLGGVDYFGRPLNEEALYPALAKLVSNEVERQWENLSPLQSAALKTSLKCIEDCFDKTRHGEPVPVESVKQTSRLVVDAVAGEGLSEFMNGIRNHHNYTFRHSMFVCGMLVAFGSRVRATAEDLRKLAVGGMLHDIGKSRVALKVLDKPGKLDDDEWLLMRTHPANAELILGSQDGIDPEVIAMATQHHEKLDGTGYPYGLSGSQISDLVRMTSIVDVYSSLIEKRAYKPAFPKEKALSIMSGMEGHLDLDLVKIFRGLVLDQE